MLIADIKDVSKPFSLVVFLLLQTILSCDCGVAHLALTLAFYCRLHLKIIIIASKISCVSSIIKFSLPQNFFSVIIHNPVGCEGGNYGDANFQVGLQKQIGHVGSCWMQKAFKLTVTLLWCLSCLTTPCPDWPRPPLADSALLCLSPEEHVGLPAARVSL